MLIHTGELKARFRQFTQATGQLDTVSAGPSQVQQPRFHPGVTNVHNGKGILRVRTYLHKV